MHCHAQVIHYQPICDFPYNQDIVIQAYTNFKWNISYCSSGIPYNLNWDDFVIYGILLRTSQKSQLLNMIVIVSREYSF